MTLGWGIIGPGRVADNFMVPGISADPNSELVCVVSRDQARGEAFAAKHGGRRAVTDYAAMLADPEVGAVLVTTPNALHPDQVVAAAEAGKHVLCDKPLGATAAEAARALEACAKAGVRLGLNFQTRHHTCLREARDIIRSGEIGDVVYAQMDASPGVGQLMGWRTDPALAVLGSTNNVAIHVYDALRFLLGAEVTEVTAMFETGREPKLERLPMTLLRFSNGALAYATGNQVTFRPLNDLVIHGTKGRIDGRGVTRPGQDGEMRVVSEAGERSERTSTHDAYSNLVAAFTRAVLEGHDPDPSGVDGLRSVELTDAIARSVREGRVVTLAD